MEQVIISLFSVPFDVADTNPISGLVASALKFALLNEGLQEIQGMVIDTNLVIGDSFGVKGQGRMRKRALLATKGRFFSLVDLSQPMRESRDLTDQAAEP